MRYRPLITAAILSLLLTLCAHAHSQTFPVNSDTYVSTDAADVGAIHGYSPVLVVDTNNVALFYFNLSSLPSSVTASQVSQATVTFYIDALANPAQVNLMSLKHPFVEATTNGYSLPSSQVTYATFTPSSADSYVTIDIASLVQA